MFCRLLCLVFFFKQKTEYDMRISDWSSDVCSADRRRDHASAGAVALYRRRTDPEDRVGYGGTAGSWRRARADVACRICRQQRKHALPLAANRRTDRQPPRLVALVRFSLDVPHPGLRRARLRDQHNVRWERTSLTSRQYLETT